MPGSVDYNTVVQELADRHAVYIGTRQIDGVAFQLYRVGSGELKPELIAIDAKNKVVARGNTMEQVTAVKNGATPPEVPEPTPRPDILPPTGQKPPPI